MFTYLSTRPYLLSHVSVTPSPFRLFSTSSAPRKGGGGSTALLVSAVLVCGAIVAYVHTSQKTAQEKMHRAVVLDKEKLKARRAAQREAERKQTSSQTTESDAAQSGSS